MKPFRGWQSGLVLLGTAAAQEVAAQESAGQDIVVTAQRREQSLQEVPLAVNVFSGEEVAERGLTDVRDLSALTPGATFTFINAAEPVISLRGISSGGEGAASEAGVLMMIDGEVISRDFLRAAPIFDVERVEVLRGPQGTTYGRNATAGVFHIISRLPTDEFKVDTAVTVGNYDQLLVDAAVQGALGANTRARVAFRAERRDGFSTDYFNGRDVDYRKAVASRVTIVHDVTPDLTLTARGSFSVENHGETGPLKAYDATQPFLAPSRFAPAFTELSADPYRVGTSRQSYFDRETYAGSIELNWSGPINLISLTTYRRGDNDYIQGAPAGLNPRGYNVVTGFNGATTFSQEVRGSGLLAADRVLWTVGGFLLKEDVDFRYRRVTLSLEQMLVQNSKATSLGIFGEVEWRATDALTVTAGGRYSSDEKSFVVRNEATGPARTAFVLEPSGLVVADLSDTWGRFTGRLSAEYRWRPGLSTYFTLSQGYKSGGFNAEPPTTIAANTPFDQESVTNREIGVRSSWLDRRLTVNVTAFDMIYKDIQTPVFVGGLEIVDNYGSASIRGVEVELSARPTRLFGVSAAVSALDAKFNDFTDPSGNNLNGRQIPRAPTWTATASATARTPEFADGGHLAGRVDYRTRSEVFQDVPVDRLQGIRPRTDQLDLRVSWEVPQPDVQVSLWVRNILDQAEVQYIGPRTPSLLQRPVIYGPPRTVGVTFQSAF